MALRRFILTSSGEKLSEVLREPADIKDCEGITSAGAPTTFTANASGDIVSMSLKSPKPESAPRGGVQSRLSASLRLAIVAGREGRKLYALRLITYERMCGPLTQRTLAPNPTNHAGFKS